MCTKPQVAVALQTLRSCIATVHVKVHINTTYIDIAVVMHSMYLISPQRDFSKASPPNLHLFHPNCTVRLKVFI